jgi:hypothetical protein
VAGLGGHQEGRKSGASATRDDGDGRVVASAAHRWVAVDPAAFA